MSELSTEAWSPTAAWIRSRIVSRSTPSSTRTFTPPTEPASPTSSVARSAVKARIGALPPKPAAALGQTRDPGRVHTSSHCDPNGVTHAEATVVGGEGVDDHVLGTRRCPALGETNREHPRVVGPVAHQPEVETFRLARLVEELCPARHDTVRRGDTRDGPDALDRVRGESHVGSAERRTRPAVEATAALGANRESRCSRPPVPARC